MADTQRSRAGRTEAPEAELDSAEKVAQDPDRARGYGSHPPLDAQSVRPHMASGIGSGTTLKEGFDPDSAEVGATSVQSDGPERMVTVDRDVYEAVQLPGTDGTQANHFGHRLALRKGQTVAASVLERHEAAARQLKADENKDARRPREAK